MKIWHSTDNKKEIESLRDNLKAKDECIFYKNKKVEVIKGIRTRIMRDSKNKNLFILWVGKR